MGHRLCGEPHIRHPENRHSPESRLRVLGSRLISVPRSFTPCLLLNEPFLARERPLLEKPDVLSDRDSFLKEPDLLRVGSLLEELDLRKERSLLEDPDRLTDRFFWEPDLLMGPSDRRGREHTPSGSGGCSAVKQCGVESVSA
eukprot:scaffold7022_cov18-Tisochrysis_lutea.AAC.1